MQEQNKGSNSYTQILSLLLTSASGRCFIIQISTNKSPHIPKGQNWKSITYTMQDATSKQQILGAGVFTPTTGTGYSDTITIDPGGKSPCSPSIELNLKLC
jgi:hypothetical protein